MEPSRGSLKYVRFDTLQTEGSLPGGYERKPPDPVDPRDPLPPPPFFATASPSQPLNSRHGPRVAPLSLEDPTDKRPSSRFSSFRTWLSFKFQRGVSKARDPHRVFAEELKWGKAGVFDPHGRFIRQWNKVFVVACLVAAAVDPLFFFLVEVDIVSKCMQIEHSFAVTVTVLRCLTDLVYLIQMMLQFRVAYVEPSNRIFGRGELVVDKESIADHYLKGNFTLDFVAWLPVPQFVLWLIIPKFHQPGTSTTPKNLLRFVVILQYIPRVVRVIPIQSSLQRPGTLAFETASSGFIINLMIFLLASHVIAAAFYLLGIERVDHCWRQVCPKETGCRSHFFDCSSVNEPPRVTWNSSSNITDVCILRNDPTVFNYGIYQPILKVVGNSGVKRYFFSLWWGLRNLTSMGQPLVPSNFTWELLFSIVIALTGMLLLAMLVGNMQKYLQSLGRRVEEHRTMLRDTEAWMKHRLLPADLCKRIRRYDRFKWNAMHGVDEEKLLGQLPEDLTAEIKRQLCLDLIKRVPLFEKLDDLVLDAICERLKPQLFIQGSCIIREGDPALRMLFIIGGQLGSTESTDGQFDTLVDKVTLKTGDFVGDELLTWCLDPRPKKYYPSSLRTVVADSDVRAFSLNADDLRYVTSHFLKCEHRVKLRRALRSYSPHWRYWAALAIQGAWRRYRRKKDGKGLVDESINLGTSAAVYTHMFVDNARRVRAARAHAEASDQDSGLQLGGGVHSSRTIRSSGDLGGNGSALRQRSRGRGARNQPPLQMEGMDEPVQNSSFKLTRVPTPTGRLVGFGDQIENDGLADDIPPLVRKRADKPKSLRPVSPTLPPSPMHQRVPTPTPIEVPGVNVFDNPVNDESRVLRPRGGGSSFEPNVEYADNELHAFDVDGLHNLTSVGRALIDGNASSSEASSSEAASVPPSALDRIPSIGRALEADRKGKQIEP